MNKVLLQSKFNFNHYTFSKYKYTDARRGAVYNFLAYMVKGNARIVSKSRTIIINKGDVFFIPKNLSYQSYWYGNEEIEFVSLGFLELDTNEHLGIELQSVHACKEIAESILNIPTNGKNISSASLCRFFHAFSLVLPLLSKSDISKEKFTIELIKETITDNPFDSISEIALRCNISEPYLYSLFKKSESYTPNDYKQKVLCDMAIRLLTTTDKSVEEICSDLYFSSSSYFRKVLKKHTGLTPRKIRKNRII